MFAAASIVAATLPAAATACLLQGSDWARVTFVFSAIPTPECGGPAAFGNRASRTQYEPALAALAQREREFFLTHELPHD